MGFHTVGKQWDSIVLDFKVAIAYQKRKMLLNPVEEESDFNKAGIAVLEKGLAKAQVKYRKNRFAFWKNPYIATSHLFLMELLTLKEEIKNSPINDEVSRAGELAVLDSLIDTVMNKLTVTSPSGERIFIPGYRD